MTETTTSQGETRPAVEQFFEELAALGHAWRITGNMSGIIRTSWEVPCMCPILAVARSRGWQGTENAFMTLEMAKFLSLNVDDVRAIMKAADAATEWDDMVECEVHHFDEGLRDRLLRATKIVEA